MAPTVKLCEQCFLSKKSHLTNTLESLRSTGKTLLKLLRISNIQVVENVIFKMFSTFQAYLQKQNHFYSFVIRFLYF